ncbi:MAG: hypothetical protein AB7F64_07990 [Gammaproteobacteria bacterium]
MLKTKTTPEQLQQYIRLRNQGWMSDAALLEDEVMIDFWNVNTDLGRTVGHVSLSTSKYRVSFNPTSTKSIPTLHAGRFNSELSDYIEENGFPTERLVLHGLNINAINAYIKNQLYQKPLTWFVGGKGLDNSVTRKINSSLKWLSIECPPSFNCADIVRELLMLGLKNAAFTPGEDSAYRKNVAQALVKKSLDSVDSVAPQVSVVATKIVVDRVSKYSSEHSFLAGAMVTVLAGVGVSFIAPKVETIATTCSATIQTQPAVLGTLTCATSASLKVAKNLIQNLFNCTTPQEIVDFAKTLDSTVYDYSSISKTTSLTLKKSTIRFFEMERLDHKRQEALKRYPHLFVPQRSKPVSPKKKTFDEALDEALQPRLFKPSMPIKPSIPQETPEQQLERLKRQHPYVSGVFYNRYLKDYIRGLLAPSSSYNY